MMTLLNKNGTSAPLVPGCRRFPRHHSLALCILFSLAMLLRPISAFQLLLQTKRCPTTTLPTHRSTITTSLLSNKDPDTEIIESSNLVADDTKSEISISSTASFGESVPYVPLSQQQTSDGDASLFSVGSDDNSSSSSSSEVEILKQNRIRNIAVAIASFAFAIFNYGWQFTHPVSAVEILASMEKQSAPLTAIGNNGKPTVIDFWAPWCENCKVAAPTLQAVEQEYGDRVNFISVNADNGQNWPLIQYFGVDAIPHLALLSGEGDAETALIGPMSRNVLRSDIDALLNQREGCAEKVEVVKVCHDELPYKMFDAFGNRPDSRRVNFVEQ